MKQIFITLFILLSASSNAATMCMPDLGTCTGCTNATYIGDIPYTDNYIGLMWSAKCCGVDVTGLSVWIGGKIINNRCKEVKGVFSLQEWGLANRSCLADWCYSCGCIVFVPGVGWRGYAFDGYTYNYSTGTSTVNVCAKICAENASTIIQALF